MNEFPHVVTFKKLVKVADGGGGFKDGYIDFLTTEAFVCPVSSNERYQSMQIQNPVDYSLFFPYQVGVTSDMQAYWHDRDIALKIKGKPVDQGGQGEILMVKCTS